MEFFYNAYCMIIIIVNLRFFFEFVNKVDKNLKKKKFNALFPFHCFKYVYNLSTLAI